MTRATAIQMFRAASLKGKHLRREHPRILRSCVARRADDSGLAESYCTELVEKGAAFFGPRYSGKPIVLVVANFNRKRLLQDEFGNECCATGAQHSRKLPEDRLPLGVQVENSINQGGVN